MRTPSGLPSASRLQLAVTCPASQALPVVDSELEAGHEGTELHDLLMRHVVGERSPDELQQSHPWLDSVLETVGDRLQCAAVEVAYGWDTATSEARLFGSRIGRHYPERPASMLVGTVDYVVTEQTQLLAVDLKSGLMEQPPVKRLQQMRFAALAVATWDGFSRPVQTAILHAPRDGRRPWWEWGPRYDSLDLIEVADTFRAMVARIGYARKDVAAGKTPRLTKGAHCRFCPALDNCPANTGLMKQAVSIAPSSMAVAHSEAGTAWEVGQAMIDLGKAIQSQACAQVAIHGPAAMSDGRVLGRHQKKGRPTVDGQKAFDAIEKRWGLEAAKEAVSMDASKTSVWEAISKRGRHGSKKKLADEFIDELKASKVIAEKWTEDVGPYDPDEVLSAKPALASTTAQPPGAAALALSQPGDAAQETQ